jgi:hypothetical protein
MIQPGTSHDVEADLWPDLILPDTAKTILAYSKQG